MNFFSVEMRDKENLRKFYSLELKAKVILYYRSLQNKQNIKEKSINLMESMFGVDRRVIGRWIKKGDLILNSTDKRNSFKTKPQVFRSVCEAMELQLKEWILTSRSDGKCLSGDVIQKEAVKLYNQIHPLVPHNNNGSICVEPRVNFVASGGWLQNFCKRRHFAYRRVSTTGRELPSDILTRCHNFFKQVIFYFCSISCFLC